MVPAPMDLDPGAESMFRNCSWFLLCFAELVTSKSAKSEKSLTLGSGSLVEKRGLSSPCRPVQVSRSHLLTSEIRGNYSRFGVLTRL